MSTENSPEDEYFAREEIEKQHKLAREIAAKRAAHEAEALQKAHWRKCPQCGNDLQPIAFKGVEVQRCFHCHGTFLQADAFNKLAAPEGPHRLIDALVNVFAHKQ